MSGGGGGGKRVRETERVCVRVVIIDVTYTSVGVPFTIVADPEYIAKSSYLEKVINVLALRLESCRWLVVYTGQGVAPNITCCIERTFK